MTTDAAPLLTQWFEFMDSKDPDRILDLISDDFRFSIVFSTGEDSAADFSGGRPEMEGYLEQREKGTRIHVLLSASVDGDDEMVLGEVRRGNDFEASFFCVARLDEGRVRRMLIGRSPGVVFTDVW